ncbi:MAG: zinc-binding dehydrogenase [Phycisphaera sp.]|nr:zinc-binding dehydrogenase [Phycisphaera sp.]
MKTIAITGKKSCRIVDKRRPTAKEDYVVVKIHTAPLCTEYTDYRDGCTRAEFERGAESPDCLGHEAAGEVVEVAQPGKVKVGDRVVVMPGFWCGKCRFCLSGEYIHCQHPPDPLKVCGCEAGAAAYAEYCLKQDWLLLPIPEGMSYDHAAMACCGLGPAFNSTQKMAVNGHDTVLIAGTGPVGLGAVIAANYRGARVISLGRNAYRTELALKLGAEAVLDPQDPKTPAKILEMTGGEGASKSIETTGFHLYMDIVMKATRRRGHIAIVGEGGDYPLPISDGMIRTGLTLHGIWHWNLADAPDMMNMISRVGDKLDTLITHHYPLDKIEDAWKLQLTGRCGKVILHP